MIKSVTQSTFYYLEAATEKACKKKAGLKFRFAAKCSLCLQATSIAIATCKTYKVNTI